MVKNLMEVGIELCPEEARAERGRTHLRLANQNASFIPSGLGWTHLRLANGRGLVQDRKVRTRLRLANQE